MAAPLISPSLSELPEPICGGCGLEIDESSANAGAIHFSNSLWHIDCFRCAKCNNRVTTGQDDLLLLSDGHPICSSCNYTCQVCRLPILEEAILTGDEAYHASCFTCRVCNQRIEELVFAKTSQGIYCMDCHHTRVERSRRHAEARKQRAAARAAAAAGGSSAPPAATSVSSPALSSSRPASPPASASPRTARSKLGANPQSSAAMVKSDSTPLTRPAPPEPSPSSSSLNTDNLTTRASPIPTTSASSPIPSLKLVPASSAAASAAAASSSQSRSSSALSQSRVVSPALAETPMGRTATSASAPTSAPSSLSKSSTAVSRPTTANSLTTTTAAESTTSTYRASAGSSSASSTTSTGTTTTSNAQNNTNYLSAATNDTSSSVKRKSSTGNRAGDRASKTYSFYDPDFVDLMDSFGKIGAADSDLSLSLPDHGDKDAADSAATGREMSKSKGLPGTKSPSEDEGGSGSGADETIPPSDLGADYDRRRTLKPGSFVGVPTGNTTGLGMIPSASASMDSLSFIDGYESTDSSYLLDNDGSSSNNNHLRRSRANTAGSEYTPDEGDSLGRSSSALYLAAVSEAEKRMRERADSAAKLDSNYYPPGSASSSRAGSRGAEEEEEMEDEQEVEGESSGARGLTREGTLRASSSALSPMGGSRNKAPGASSSSSSARGGKRIGGPSGSGRPPSLNTAPLRALSLKVKEKIQGVSASSSSSAAAGAKEGKAELVQMEPELLDALLNQLDEARDKMELMQGRYDGMKRASKIATHGYNVASHKFELEVNARYEAEVEMASLKRKLAEQASKLSAVTGEQKRKEALLRRSQDVRSMVTDMERNLAMLTVERDVRMAELAQLTAGGVEGKTPTETLARSPSSSSLSPALPSPSGVSNPLLSPLLGGSGGGKTSTGSASSSNKPLPGILPPTPTKDTFNLNLNNDNTVVSNLSTRLDSVKERYKREIDDLALERDSLLLEIEELRQSRDVFVDEAQALNARNEESSAQLNLVLKRIEFAQRQEAAKMNAVRVANKQLPPTNNAAPSSSSSGAASGGGGGRYVGGGGSAKHRANGSLSSASELNHAQLQQQQQQHHHHHHQQQQQQQQQQQSMRPLPNPHPPPPPQHESGNAEIARPVRVQKAEATPVVKKFKWMKVTAKVAGQGFAAALPGAAGGANGSNLNGGGGSGSGNNNGGGDRGANGGGGMNVSGSLSPNGMIHGPVSPGSGSGSAGGSTGPGMNGHAHMNGNVPGGSVDGPPGNAGVDGLVVREHLFQPFNILRPIRCFACQKSMWGQTEVRCSLCGQSCHSKCLQNLPTSCLKPYSGGQETAEPTGPSMFGRDLVEQATAEGREVPEIVEKCVAAVESSGMDYEGIYRKSGGTSQLRVITQLFERGQPFDLEDMDRFNDVSAITSVLKNYFRELPIPLLTFDLHESFVRVAEMRGEYEGKMERMAELIGQLPSVHFWTLRALVVHLHRVQSRSDENRMNSRNLGVVFGPTLMRSSDPSQEFAHMGGKAMTIEFFIDNPSLFAV
ncbi:hypothetical protein A4X13_0g3086 [Tilletia indica]|uniref:RhoGAP-domain-containing protein n=1 Tax=Tilletia indica TaxID=43049 RepID=A0A177TPY4_9BASI|nr:hypothetical protein A4X13_0g3086 [Tilletia indica]